MLTPDYLEHVADDLVRLYAQLEVSIIEDISRRITKNRSCLRHRPLAVGKITASRGSV